MRNIYVRFAAACLCLLFARAVEFAAPRRSHDGHPHLDRAIDSYGDISCEHASARLDSFALALSNLPAAVGYIVVYEARGGSRLRAQRHGAFAYDRLVVRRGIDAERLKMIWGGPDDELMVRLYIVPNGATPPQPTPTVSEGEARTRAARLFDRGRLTVRRDGGGRPALVTSYDCLPDAVDLGEYAKALRAEPDAAARVVVYGARGARLSEANAVSRLVRHRLFTVENIAHRRISVVYGGTREEPSVELWLVPRGASPPAARRR